VQCFFKAGFRSNCGAALPSSYDLWIVSFKRLMSDDREHENRDELLALMPEAGKAHAS